MDMKFSFLILYAIVAFTDVNGRQKCSGDPPKYHGKNCASTTHYTSVNKGACGCGPDTKDEEYFWSKSGLTAAINQLFFDVNNKIWCGKYCGRCVRLNTTGGYVDGYGSPTPEGESKVFMVTNLCSSEGLNRDWCGQNLEKKVDKFGYGWHFDLENGYGQIENMGWINPEVTWEWADCDLAHLEDYRTPSSGNYKQCFCGKQ